MSYRYGSSSLNYLYDEMKGALVENGLDVFMQVVSDALTSVFCKNGDFTGQIKVIGNIFDNPELVNSKLGA